MTRVEWTVLSGDDAETLLANLLYSEYPRAVRVRPSQGDFGIDVLVPTGIGEDFDVYQIKRFAQTLTDGQRTQVKDSFKRLLIGLVRRGIPVADWYLVMPIDPTLDNYMDWFLAMPGEVIKEMFLDDTLALTDDEIKKIEEWFGTPGRIIKWQGLTFCEDLAAKYSYVVDYYLHGLREAIKSAVSSLSAILQRDVALPSASGDAGSALLTPSEAQAHLRRLQEVLDTDPHFRYGISIDPSPPEIVRLPDLVAATQETREDGQTITVRIFSRFAESLAERPIPLKVKFLVGDDAAVDPQAFALWRKYGVPFVAPAEVEADLPGGLGAMVSGQSEVSIQPAGLARELRFAVRRVDGTSTEPLLFSLTRTSGPDGTGLREYGADQSGTITLDVRLDLEAGSGTWHFARGQIVGTEAAVTVPLLELLHEFRSPNILQIGERYGPLNDLGELSGDVKDHFPDLVMQYLKALLVIQTYTSTPILIPDLAAASADDVQAVLQVAALLEGQTLVGTWGPEAVRLTWLPVDSGSDGATVSGDTDEPEAELDLAKYYEIQVLHPLTVAIGDQVLTLGTLENRLLSARFYDTEDGLRHIRPHLNDDAQRRFAPEIPVPDDPEGRVGAEERGTIAEST